MTATTGPPEQLPAWVRWQQRPFPDANLLLLRGSEAAMVDSGFVGHAQQTLDWANAHAGHIAMVVNTHWHSGHVGGNALRQATVWKRYRRWAGRGTWDKVHAALLGEADLAGKLGWRVSVDSTVNRAHQHGTNLTRAEHGTEGILESQESADRAP